MTEQTATEVAILGGGCFWCLEAVYLEVRGVKRVESGYMGGHTANPSYEQVCAGTSGHAEVVRLEFDPGVVTYRDILEIFFTIHDPTTVDRQGNDVGPQYRSVIFFTSPEQEATARKVMAEMAGVWDAPIVTQLQPAQTWYKAEDYHQDYFNQHPLQGYCAFVVAPKVAKFRKVFTNRLKEPVQLARTQRTPAGAARPTVGWAGPPPTRPDRARVDAARGNVGCALVRTRTPA
jgi:peptide-methionine (S)-S-oxide reductase